MQTVSQATEIVAYVTGTQRGRASQIARALIDAELLPKSSGRDIKKIDPQQILPLLAAVVMTDRVADAPKVAREFASLPFEGRTDTPDTLASMFASVLTRPGWKRAKIEFAKQQSGYAATIDGNIAKGDAEVKMFLPFWRDRSWGGFCKASFTISEEGIEVMRNLFARDDIEGMHFSLSTGRDRN